MKPSAGQNVGSRRLDESTNDEHAIYSGIMMLYGYQISVLLQVESVKDGSA